MHTNEELQQAYNRLSAEQTSLTSQVAVLKQQISDACTQLNIPNDDNLLPSLQSLKVKLETELSDLNTTLSSLLDEINSLPE